MKIMQNARQSMVFVLLAYVLHLSSIEKQAGENLRDAEYRQKGGKGNTALSKKD